MDKSPKVVVLSKQNGIVENIVAILRDKEKQKNKTIFRQTLRILGTLIAYEMAKTMSYKKVNVETPLGWALCNMLVENPVIVGLLRAAIPLMEGFENIFPEASYGFIASYRKYDSDHSSFVPQTSYVAIPDINNKPLIIVDPMIATASCLKDAITYILEKGQPLKVYIGAVITSSHALEYMNTFLPEPFYIYTCCVDEKINMSGYIVPGLGDAGDLAYGSKL